MNSKEQAQRKSAIDELRSYVTKSVDDSDKAMTILVTEHTKIINERLKELENQLLAKMALSHQQHKAQIAMTQHQWDNLLEVVHQKAIKSEAILARKFWGRLKWLARGR